MAGVPDAWDDDDWEVQADRAAKEEGTKGESVPAQPMTRSERLAKHAESNRKLWESAETPDETPFAQTASDVPLATGFKPAMKVLSRKPAPRMVARRDPITGLARMSLQADDDEDDDGGGGAQKDEPTPEERRRRQQRELEEKQRRYDEARAKIFGDSGTGGSGAARSRTASPRNDTPPSGSEGRGGGQRARGRGRGGRRIDGRQDSRGDSRSNESSRPASRSSARDLYDPGYAPKPGFMLQRRAGEDSPAQAATPPCREEEQAIRAPRGPDGSGRGGFGFAKRDG